jgi:DNA-binding NarL/FixJ family response regulator
MMDTAWKWAIAELALFGSRGNQVNGPIKVIILDGDDAYRRMVCAWLAGVDGITVVGEANEAPEALLLIQKTGPDAILLDVRTMQAGAPRLVGQIRALSPGTGIIVLNEESQEREVLVAFREGALGHLVKGKVGAGEVAAAIRLVSRGQAVLSPDVAGRILDKLVQRR